MSPRGIETIGQRARYFRLLAILVKTGLMKQMAYRPHFFLMILGKTIRIALLFFFFQAVFMKVTRIGDWTYERVLLLFATFQVVDYLISVTFQRNLAGRLPHLVQSGELDARLLLPANLLFLVSLEEVDMMDFFSLIPTLGFLGYSVYRLDRELTVTGVILYLVLLGNALVFLYAASLIIAATSFWTTQSHGLAGIFDDLMKVGRYPLDIFQGFWRTAFIYLLPLAVIAQFPAQALLENLSWPLPLYAFTVSGACLLAALRLWRLGLNKYSSPGI